MFEAYKIGIRLSLINHASMGLLGLNRDFMKSEAAAGKLNSQIDKLSKAAMKGGIYFGAGVGIAEMLKGPYEAAKKLEQERQKFETLNLSASSNAAAFAQAQMLAHKNLGSTIGENIALIRDLHTAIGDLPHAIGMSEDFQKFSIAAKVQNDGRPVDGLVYNAVKALEHRGSRISQNPVEMRKELGLMSGDYFGSGGKVGPNDFFHASQTGKMAYTLFDPEYLYGQFAAYMQAKTGSTAGTSSMTAFSSLIGGHMDNKAKGFLASLGLLQLGVSKAQVQLINSSIASLNLPESEKKKLRKAEMPITGGLKDDDAILFAHRPDRFVNEVLVPAIRKRYGMDMTNEQIALLVAKSFNRSTSDNLGELIINGQKFRKDASIFAGAKQYGSAYDQYIKSPAGAEEATDAAWKNFLAVFGTLYLPVITKGLTALAVSLDSLSKEVEAHPIAFKALAYSLGLVALGLGLRGGGLLLSVAFKGLGLALAFSKIGGATGIASIAGAIGGAGKGALVGALGGLMSPIGLAVAALATLALGIYAFRPMSQKEIDGYKDGGGAQLTPDAKQRLAALGGSPYIKGANSSNAPLRGNVLLDKHLVGSVMWDHAGHEASRPAVGSGMFDATLSLPPPSLGYQR